MKKKCQKERRKNKKRTKKDKKKKVRRMNKCGIKMKKGGERIEIKLKKNYIIRNERV